MNSFKKIFVEYRINSELKKKKIKDFTSFRDAQSIGIFFSVEDKDKHEAVKELIKELEKNKKEVKTLAFLPKGKENYEFLFDFFTEEDMDFSGRLKSTYALDFIKKPFDFLIYLDQDPHLLGKYIMATSNAKCLAGFYHEELEDILDFMLKEDNTALNFKNTINKLYYYITLANSSNA